MGQWTAMFDGQIELPASSAEASPDVCARQLEAIPAKRGIVALLAESDKPLILLPAADMRSRLRSRLAAPETDKATRSIDLRSVARKALWKVTLSHFATDLAYLELARLIWPKTYHKLLSWKGAWFVHADATMEYPRFVRAREAPALCDSAEQGRRSFGPFVSARSADAFISALQDGFDLCRDYRCLRQAPNAQPCAYAQMGRCLGPCDGSISMQDYRSAVAAAVSFAAGKRVDHIQQLKAQIQQAAGELEFERAAAMKAKLDSLGELDRGALAMIRPAEQFRFIIVQGTGRFSKAEVFLADGGRIVTAGLVDYPPDGRQLGGILRQMAKLAGTPGQMGRAEWLRMGLVSRYLFSSDQRRGLMLRWRESVCWEQLAGAIEESAGVLKLRCRKKRAPKSK